MTGNQGNSADGARSVLAVVTRFVGLLLVTPIRLYQRFVSPLTPPSCRYHPSCSTYAVEAITVHGPLKGPLLSGWRLLRCNPWTKGGVDPVPARGSWLPDVLPDGKPRSATMVPPERGVDTGTEHHSCTESDN